ncbi:retropepsin-like aspartic protease family protein [Legionella massiliensis]|uniref:retropepsin-like aspartic protease family protein n=1 Tax=Legionella massiliensis TaxID=1034943 RepID=UPI0005C37E03|nr:retropepsin-like aspartic protease [Legionella massiliensis]
MSDKQYAQTGRSMFIIAWLFLFFLMFLFFRYYNGEAHGSYQINHGMVMITPGEDGHYYVKGQINEHPVEFLVDTGASLVAIPQKLAEQLNLQGRYEMTVSTASGEVTGSLTRLNQLSFGGFNLTDVKAVIVPGSDDDTILLGMNVLSQFNLSQEKQRLIIKKD